MDNYKSIVSVSSIGRPRFRLASTEQGFKPHEAKTEGVVRGRNWQLHAACNYWLNLITHRSGTRARTL